MDDLATSSNPTFIDLFSGCGGLSLGLSQAGWQGIFAVERATDAFETFRANFLGDHARHRFQWPAWLGQRAHSIDDVLANHRPHLERLRGKIDLIAGGPPCQGFSFAGKRNGADPRNKMFERYVTFVELIRPNFLVLENVPGMNVVHANQRGKRGGDVTYYQKLISALGNIGYKAHGQLLDASSFGVPQRRPRLVVVGVRDDIAGKMDYGCEGVFPLIDLEGARQLAEHGEDGKPVSAEQAISDLCTGRWATRKMVPYVGDGSRRGYLQVRYDAPKTKYQELMNAGVPPSRMDSMRIARHRPDVETRFEEILANCPRGVNLSAENREHFGMLKHRTVPMARDMPAPTLTTLPDDILHYKDPRILTVREYARIQSFPDWFEFKGKYTTGGDRRKVECPRYTQVGNAVPPLLGQAIGGALLQCRRSVVARLGQSPTAKPDKPGKRLIKAAEVLAGH